MCHELCVILYHLNTKLKTWLSSGENPPLIGEANPETDSHDTNTGCVRKEAGRRSSDLLIDVSLGSKVRDLLKGPEEDEWPPSCPLKK